MPRRPSPIRGLLRAELAATIAKYAQRQLGDGPIAEALQAVHPGITARQVCGIRTQFGIPSLVGPSHAVKGVRRRVRKPEGPRPNTYNPTKARADYEALGPLDADDIAYLERHGTDRRKRTVLTNWYGRQGGYHAWLVYREHRHQTRREAA